MPLALRRCLPGVQIERRLDFAVTQDSLSGFRFDFRFVHQPVSLAVTQIVKSEAFFLKKRAARIFPDLDSLDIAIEDEPMSTDVADCREKDAVRPKNPKERSKVP